MPVIYSRIETPTGASAPDIIANKSEVKIGAGTTAGFNPVGQKAVAVNGNLTCVEATAVKTDSTAFVFLAKDGSGAYLDSDPNGKNLPVAEALKIGRAWKGPNGEFVVCQGKRTGGSADYNIGGDPVPRRLIDQGSSAMPVAPKSAFQGQGGMSYEVKVTVTGGNAKVTISDASGNVVSAHRYGSGNNQPDTIVFGTVGDILEFTTDPGTTITMVVAKGTETL